MSAEGGDPKMSAAELLRKQLRKKSSSVHDKSIHQRIGKKQARLKRSFHLKHSHPFIHPMPHPPVAQWVPSRQVHQKMHPQYMAPMAPYVQLSSVKKKRHRVKSTKMKKDLKTGTMIANLSHALEDFKKRRDKFLNYLAQLQEDLNKLNLPSPSKEKMVPRDSSDLAKKELKKKKRKPLKLKNDSKLLKNHLELKCSEVAQKKKNKTTAKKEITEIRKEKPAKQVAGSHYSLREV